MKSAPTSRSHDLSTKRLVALAGNPNSGKTTLFNALTGLRQKVANYGGVTVERKMGTLRRNPTVDLLDLPGTYSLTPRSPEEAIARDVLLGEAPDTPKPDLVVVVVDASNLERNLFLATQILELGVPTLIALNMMDVAESFGSYVDGGRLASMLGVPVIPMVASRGKGLDVLVAHLTATTLPTPQRRRWTLPSDVERAVEEVAAQLRAGTDLTPPAADSEAIRLLAHPEGLDRFSTVDGEAIRAALQRGRDALASHGDDPATFEAEYRYRWIRGITRQCLERKSTSTRTLSDRADAVLTHKIAGPLIFVTLMALLFQAIFAWAAIPMGWIDAGITALGGWIRHYFPDGALESLLVDGVIAGVGAVVIFLPQILFLFLFISLLEDTGYMARAAFMMDKLMRRVGLHGKAFIPLLSSFACAVPGIMATRTIESRKDRFVTILVAPLMTCSARLPVYTLLLTAFLPGGPTAKALTLTGLYVAGVVAAIGSAFVLKRTLLKSETPALILELPPYKLPNLRSVLLTMWDRSRAFLQRAGTIILSVSVVLWFLATYPRSAALQAEFEAKEAALERSVPESMREAQQRALEAERAAAELRASFAGMIGRALEPLIRPLGFDWRIGIGLVSSFAAREVFVSAMGTIYSVGEVGDDVTPLVQRLREATWESGPRAKTSLFTFPTVVALLVFYVLALQCMSTVATIWRETNSWKWPLLAWTYMAVLAYGGALLARWVAEVFV